MIGDRNALDVRLALEKTHPEIRITTPLTSDSGKWELAIGKRSTAIFDDFWLMIDALAGQYGDIEAM